MANNFTIAPAPWQQFFDTTGAPLTGGLLYIDQAGLSGTAATTYQTSAGTAWSYPIQLDAYGRAAVYLAPGSYLFRVYRADGSLIRTQDNVQSMPSSSVNTDIIGTMGVAGLAGNGVYLSDGSGGLVAGRWYLWDSANAYSSILPEIGILPNDIGSGVSGTIRLVGQVTVPAVTTGTSYYVGATGALTASPGSDRRFVGDADSVSTIILKDKPIATRSGTNNFRLTLTTGTAVTTPDVTAATTLYYTPYNGNEIALYDGSSGWNVRTSAEISIAVPATTSQMYDVFAYDNAGTVALELLAWTSDTARATALILQNGVPVKTGATTRRYVGSFRTTTVSGQTEDSAAKRYVFSCNNRVRTFSRVIDTTDSWTYSTATYRQADGGVANQIDLVVGLAETLVDVTVQAFASNDAGNPAYISIGYDSTTTPATGVIGQGGQFQAANQIMPLTARLTHYPAVGRHTYVWLEKAAGGATTWRGDNADGTLTQSGIQAVFEK